MNNGSGPISMPVRVLAAILGTYLGVGGALLFATGLSSFPHLWLAALQGLVTVVLGATFLFAAKTGQSPAWPD
jgi:cadmium resistance protein CadD (predicted permease)